MKNMSDTRRKNILIALSTATVSALSGMGSASAQTLNCPQPLIFGEFTVTCAGAATATVNTSDNQSVTGCITAGGAPHSRANCTVSQSFPFQNIQVSVPSNINMTRISGTETIPVTDFNLVTNSNGPVYSSSSPFINVPIGATLNTSGIVSGDYSGTFTVNAVFN
jgi:hypothetical protein